MKLLKKTSFAIAAFAAASAAFAGTQKFPRSEAEDTDKLMSKEYWAIWNPEVQKKIDAEIEKNRKADAVVNLGEAAPGGDVKVEQIKHDFIFGAHIFNFNQLGSYERNKKYRDLYGELFNSATVALYWKKLEMEPNRPRFVEEYWDTEEYWNNCKNPKEQPHWRRPAPDPVIEYCNSRGIRIHGHPLVWGNQRWHYPDWIRQYLSKEEKKKFPNLGMYGEEKKALRKLPQAEADKLLGNIGEKIGELYEKRVAEIAERYAGKIHSFDVVNESATDYSLGLLVPGSKVTRSTYGIMPGDYAFHAFNIVQKHLPTNTAFNINDYKTDDHYVAQIKDMQKRGARIDIAGVQEHVFNYREPKKIMAGESFISPEALLKRLNDTAKSGHKIHISEVTITGNDDSPKSRARQALYAENQYRLWFSHPNVMGITWWNTVDDCGMKNEPSHSGIFTRDMQPKPVYHVLDNLINKEWKTNLTVKPDSDGKISFRGFRGTYKISWKDKYGRDRQMLYHLK